jgi:hypothetical protein
MKRVVFLDTPCLLPLRGSLSVSMVERLPLRTLARCRCSYMMDWLACWLLANSPPYSVVVASWLAALRAVVRTGIVPVARAVLGLQVPTAF